MTQANFIQEKPKMWAQGLFEQSLVAKQRIGTIRELEDGRKYAYARASAAADLAAGKLVQSIAVDTACQDITCPVTAIGARTINLTMTATVGYAANDLAGGFLHVNDVTGEGHSYKIRGNDAFVIAVATPGNIYLYDEIRVALDATSQVYVTPNRQWKVFIQPAAFTGGVAGIPPRAVTASYYFWNQVKGECACWVGATWVLGEELAVDNAIPGSAEPMIHATTLDTTIGIALTQGVLDEYGLIALSIPGY